MTNKKPTDNEIVKALECCIKSSHFGECFDNKCPLVSEKGCEVGKETLYPYALDLINRLQAENERLKKEVKEHIKKSVAKRKYDKALIKAEAYKEFAERLKEKAPIIRRSISGSEYYEFDSLIVDNLLKELVGE